MSLGKTAVRLNWSKPGFESGLALENLAQDDRETRYGGEVAAGLRDSGHMTKDKTVVAITPEGHSGIIRDALSLIADYGEYR